MTEESGAPSVHKRTLGNVIGIVPNHCVHAKQRIARLVESPTAHFGPNPGICVTGVVRKASLGYPGCDDKFVVGVDYFISPKDESLNDEIDIALQSGHPAGVAGCANVRESVNQRFSPQMFLVCGPKSWLPTRHVIREILNVRVGVLSVIRRMFRMTLVSDVLQFVGYPLGEYVLTRTLYVFVSTKYARNQLSLARTHAES
jgi:hypothetical protein